MEFVAGIAKDGVSSGLIFLEQEEKVLPLLLRS